jgi:hypothetical protein
MVNSINGIFPTNGEETSALIDRHSGHPAIGIVVASS